MNTDNVCVNVKHYLVNSLLYYFNVLQLKIKNSSFLIWIQFLRSHLAQQRVQLQYKNDMDIMERESSKKP